MKILLAVDGSEFTKRMLAYLAAHEELLGEPQQFNVLTVVAPVPPQVTHFICRDTLDGHYAEQAEAVLRPVMAFAARHPWRITQQFAVGHAAESIAKAATDGQFDLLVMGSHGHSSVGSLVMGSVVSVMNVTRCRLLDAAQCGEFTRHKNHLASPRAPGLKRQLVNALGMLATRCRHTIDIPLTKRNDYENRSGTEKGC